MLPRSVLAIAVIFTMSFGFAAGTSGAAPSAVKVETAVPFQEAPQFYNQVKTVEGTIVNTFCDDKRCFLNFDKDFRKYLSAVIDSADLPKFTKATGKELQAEMEKNYAGKKVHITGMITEYKSKDATKPGRPQIMLTEASKIKVLSK